MATTTGPTSTTTGRAGVECPAADAPTAAEPAAATPADDGDGDADTSTGASSTDSDGDSAATTGDDGDDNAASGGDDTGSAASPATNPATSGAPDDGSGSAPTTDGSSGDDPDAAIDEATSGDEPTTARTPEPVLSASDCPRAEGDGESEEDDDEQAATDASTTDSPEGVGPRAGSGGVLRFPTPVGASPTWEGGSADGAAIGGTIVDHLGRKVAGLEIRIAPADETGRTIGRAHTVHTGADGGYRFSRLAEGCYRIDFRPPDRYGLKQAAAGGAEPTYRPIVCLLPRDDVDDLDRVVTGPVAAERFDLHVLHLNDHHSHLTPGTIDVFVDDEIRTVEIGGFARVATVVDQRRAALGSNVLTVHAGDAVSGTLLHSVFGAAADAALMNHVCFDLLALGRHELAEVAEAARAGVRSPFVDFLDDHPCRTEILAPAGAAVAIDGDDVDTADTFPAVVTRRIGDRLVGIVAVGDEDPARPLSDRASSDQLAAARRGVADLTDRGVDHIVLISHLGLAADIDLAVRLSEVDAVVGGGSQSLLGPFGALGLRTEGDFPVESVNADGEPVCIAQAWQHAWLVGELSLTFDGKGGLLRCAGTPHLLVGEDLPVGAAEPVSGPGVDTDTRNSTDDRPVIPAVDPDRRAEQTLAPFVAAAPELARARVATATADLCAEHVPGRGFSALCLRSQSADHGGALQQLVADAALAGVEGADVALVGGGIVLEDLPAGPVTVADVHRAVPPTTGLVTIELSGADLVAVIEEAVRVATDNPRTGGAYPYAAGLRWSVTTTDPGADGTDVEVAVSDIEVLDAAAGRWAAPKPTTRYRVVTQSGPFGGVPGELQLATGGDTGRTPTRLLIEHLATLPDREVGVPAAGAQSTRSFIERRPPRDPPSG